MQKKICGQKKRLNSFVRISDEVKIIISPQHNIIYVTMLICVVLGRNLKKYEKMDRQVF